MRTFSWGFRNWPAVKGRTHAQLPSDATSQAVAVTKRLMSYMWWGPNVSR